VPPPVVVEQTPAIEPGTSDLQQAQRGRASTIG